MNNFISLLKKYKTAIFYSFLLVVMLTILSVIFSMPGTKNFFSSMELKSFDVRQVVLAEYKKPSKDIVIVTVDDPSYEYLLNHYGEWPIPREVYAQFVDYVEAQNPLMVAFDLLFIKSFKSSHYSDQKLVESFKKYDNLYTAINFDDQPVEIRMPKRLPDSLSMDLKVDSLDFNPYVFKNCRAIMQSIMDVTPNVGHINTSKSDDGVNRTAPLFVRYPIYNEVALKKGVTSYSETKYYPYLTLKLAIRYLQEKENLKADEIFIDQENNLVLGKRKLPMFKNSEVVLNWYGETGLKRNKTFTYVPFWKVIESINPKKVGNKDQLPKDFFKDKVVYLGTSVVSLSDIKMVPTEKYLPGVELHATLLNNIIDDSLIKKVSPVTNVLVTLLLAALVGVLVYLTSSIFASLVCALAVILAYLVINTYLMYFFNLWIWAVMPVMTSVLAFIVVYLIKYIIKSRDFEYTYKLATTDGLTELYNHRFFQEQMIMNIEYSKRSGSSFSLILIDIDFFKKFNDTYGHQAGDAVLKQVAQTLKKSVRSSDIVCRYGGEEMAIILRDTDREEALVAAQKICDTVANRSFKLGPDLEKNVTISLGVATYPLNGEKPSELIEYSDKGLYAAKENGRNQVGIVQE